MAKQIKPLTELQIRNAKPKDKDYKLRDGEGLYIHIKKNGKKVFRIDYRYFGKRNTYTIGEYPQISLKQARKIKSEIKDLINQGIDPNTYKKEQQRQKQLEQHNHLTSFVIDRFLEHKKSEVSKERFKKNYQGTFNNYIIPLLGNIRIDEVNKHHIIKVVKYTYTTRLEKDNRSDDKTYKAREVFSILKRLFDFALHNDYIKINPAASIDINQIIPKHQEKHLKAITDDNIKKLYKDILSIENPLKSLPLQYLALTAVRFGNVANLRWEYVDFENRVIIYPKQDMKIKEKDFRLPLTDRILEILEQIKPYSYHLQGFVFPAITKKSSPVNGNTLRKELKKFGYKGKHTLHGFRSSFQTIAAEHQREHKISIEAIEAQLHHAIGNKVTQAYLRSDFLDERRELLEWWERYLKGDLDSE